MASGALELPVLGADVEFGVAMRGSWGLAEMPVHLSALARTGEEDSATALGGVQGQLVEGEDLAPGLEDATPGAAAHSQSTHLGDRGRAWSEPPGRRPRSCWDLRSAAQTQQEFRLLILPDNQLLEPNARALRMQPFLPGYI